MQPSLTQRSIQSTAYNVGASGIQTVVQLGRSILLARLLAPQDFGVYTLVTSYLLITRALPLFGLNGALIHRAPESEAEIGLRTHFTLSLLFNLAWALVMVAFSFVAVSPGARIVLWAILATEVVDHLVGTARAQLVRLLVFRRIALIDTLSILAGSLLAVWMAWRGFGVWSLVATDIIPALFGVVGFYLIRPVWRPALQWHPPAVRYFLNFGGRNLLVNLSTSALDRVDDIFTGNVLGEVALGFYSRAYTFATYPRRILAAPVASISLSAYAELSEDRRGLSRAFFRLNAFLIRSGFYLAGLLALVAPEFIRLALTARWLPMLAAFRWMLIYTLFDPVNVTLQNLFTAMGVPERVTRIRGLQLAILVVGLLGLGPPFGISGVAVAVDAMLVVGIVLLFWQARRFVDFSPTTLLLAPAIGVMIGLAGSYGALLLVPATLSGAAADWLTGGVKSLVFSGLYLAVLILLERDQLIGMLAIVVDHSPLKGRLPWLAQHSRER